MVAGTGMASAPAAAGPARPRRLRRLKFSAKSVDLSRRWPAASAAATTGAADSDCSKKYAKKVKS